MVGDLDFFAKKKQWSYQEKWGFQQAKWRISAASNMGLDSGPQILEIFWQWTIHRLGKAREVPSEMIVEVLHVVYHAVDSGGSLKGLQGNQVV